MKPAPSAHVHGTITSRQLSEKTWPDFEKLFAANGGVWGGCWCMFYHKPGRFDSRAYDENMEAKRLLTAEGKAHGTIVFCGRDPVGWCQFGPKEELSRIDRKKGYRPTSPDAWRVTCLFIAPGHQVRSCDLRRERVGQGDEEGRGQNCGGLPRRRRALSHPALERYPEPLRGDWLLQGGRPRQQELDLCPAPCQTTDEVKGERIHLPLSKGRDSHEVEVTLRKA